MNQRFAWAFGVAVLVSMSTAVATAATPAAPAKPATSGRLTAEQALSLRNVNDVALSPDGKEILYRIDRDRTQEEGLGAVVGELYRIPYAGGTPTRLDNAGWNARKPAWSPDGQRYAWLAQANPNSRAQISLTATAGNIVLTSAAGGVESFAWSPDGKKIAYTSRDTVGGNSADRQAAGQDWIVFGVPETQLRLHIVDVGTRESHSVTPADLTVHFFAWSPDGRQLAIAASPSPEDDDRSLRTKPYVVDASGGTPRLLAATAGKLIDINWSPDGRWIAWLGSTAVYDPHSGSVFTVPSDSTNATPRNLTEGYEGSATSLTTIPGAPATFAFRSEEWQATLLRAVDAKTGTVSILSRAAQVLATPPSFTRDGRRFALAANAPTHPNELFTGASGNLPLKRLTDSNPSLKDTALGTQDIVRWKSKDGLPIEGVLIKPPNFEPNVRYPVVLHVHGGSESVVSNGWQSTANNLGQLLAAKGFVVLYPNYRGSRGRGVDFVSANRRDVMGREWEDTIAGLDYLIGTGIADPLRAGIYGFSWGGYAAGWGATYGSERFKAAVGGAGIYNWISEAGTNNTRMHEQLAHWDSPLYENFQLYLDRSPIFHIRNARTPMLILHGERDQSCPIGQAIEFHTALKWKGVPVELVIYPREGHGLVERAHQRDFVDRAIGWFEDYLAAGGASPPSHTHSH